MEWNCWKGWLLSLLGGLWALQRQWLRPEEKTAANNPSAKRENEQTKLFLELIEQWN